MTKGDDFHTVVFLISGRKIPTPTELEFG